MDLIHLYKDSLYISINVYWSLYSPYSLVSLYVRRCLCTSDIYGLIMPAYICYFTQWNCLGTVLATTFWACLRGTKVQRSSGQRNFEKEANNEDSDGNKKVAKKGLMNQKRTNGSPGDSQVHDVVIQQTKPSQTSFFVIVIDGWLIFATLCPRTYQGGRGWGCCTPTYR